MDREKFNLARSEVKKFQEAANEVVSFLKPRLDKRIRVKINTHTDPDGVAAGNILARCLKYYDVPFHISFGGPPGEGDLVELANQDYDLFVFLDQGTGQFQLINKHLLESDKEVLILDHHPGEIEKTPGLTFLNPHHFGLNGSKEVSASGVVYSVVEKLDDKFKPLSEMALIGALGDRQETSSGFIGINKNITEKAIEEDFIKVREGLKLDGRTFALIDCLTHSINPYLDGISGNENSSQELLEELETPPETVLEKLNSGKEKKLQEKILEWIKVNPTKELKHSLWGNIYTPKIKQVVGPKNAHEYVTMLNACEKLGEVEIGFTALLGDEDSRDKALEILREYQNHMIEVMNWIASNKEKVKTTDQFRYLDADEELESKVIGEALSTAIESGLIKTDLPILGLTKSSENELKVSARATPEYAKTGSNIGKALEKVTEELGGSGGGHDVAAAARLPPERRNEFLEKMEHHLEKGS